MIAPTPTKLYTPEDLLTMPDGDCYELVDGRLVEHQRSAWASYVVGEVLGRLLKHAEDHDLGWGFSCGNTYQCFPNAPDKVRKADVSYIRADRLSVAQAQSAGHTQIYPDLAVTLTSQTDLLYDVHNKVQDWLDAGVRLVWVINPKARFVEVHRSQGQGTILRETDDLAGEDVLPGFRLRIGDLFKTPTGAV